MGCPTIIIVKKISIFMTKRKMAMYIQSYLSWHMIFYFKNVMELIRVYKDLENIDVFHDFRNTERLC